MAAELIAASTVSTCGRDLLHVFQVISLIDFNVAYLFFVTVVIKRTVLYLDVSASACVQCVQM